LTLRIRHVEEVMGTAFTVDGVFPDRYGAEALPIVRDLCASLHRVDEMFSTWDRCSPVSRFRRGELAAQALPPVVNDVLEACEGARTISGGWFDPWAAPGGVDPTGYVKGWAGQQLLDSLRSAGASAALVNAAGDVTAFGEPEPGRRWRLGITDPFATHQILGTVSLTDSALAVSGTYERGQHIYAPTGDPTRSQVVSAAVVGPNLGLADALATGLVAGGEDAFAHIARTADHQAMLVLADGRRLHTKSFLLVR
jgi:thiamine biosynthesis lipoprotein